MPDMKSPRQNENNSSWWCNCGEKKEYILNCLSTQKCRMRGPVALWHTGNLLHGIKYAINLTAKSTNNCNAPQDDRQAVRPNKTMQHIFAIEIVTELSSARCVRVRVFVSGPALIWFTIKSKMHNTRGYGGYRGSQYKQYVAFARTLHMISAAKHRQTHGRSGECRGWPL